MFATIDRATGNNAENNQMFPARFLQKRQAATICAAAPEPKKTRVEPAGAVVQLKLTTTLVVVARWSPNLRSAAMKWRAKVFSDLMLGLPYPTVLLSPNTTSRNGECVYTHKMSGNYGVYTDKDYAALDLLITSITEFMRNGDGKTTFTNPQVKLSLVDDTFATSNITLGTETCLVRPTDGEDMKKLQTDPDLIELASTKVYTRLSTVSYEDNTYIIVFVDSFDCNRADIKNFRPILLGGSAYTGKDLRLINQ